MQVTLSSKAYDVEDIDVFTELAYEKGWSDGLPVLPPTEKRVTAMLDYIKRDPSEVIGVLSPGEGIATIEKLAINAVMAGCLPEYFPVVIAAIEALLDPKFEHMRVYCTTGGPAPLAIISGPVVKKLGFSYGEGAIAGHGNRVNATIGRAIALIMWNVGLARPGNLSHATFGSLGRFQYLLAERPSDDENPWEPLHVTNGFNPEDSVVSMFPAGGHDQISAGVGANTIDNNLMVMADSIMHLGHFQAALQRMVVVNPTAVRVFHEAGWTKQMVRDALLEKCRRPLRDIKRGGGVSVTAAYHWTKIVKNQDDDNEMVPAMMGPDHMQIAVSGGWAPPVSQCLILQSMHGEMASRKIDWSWD